MASLSPSPSLSVFPSLSLSIQYAAAIPPPNMFPISTALLGRLKNENHGGGWAAYHSRLKGELLWRTQSYPLTPPAYIPLLAGLQSAGLSQQLSLVWLQLCLLGGCSSKASVGQGCLSLPQPGHSIIDFCVKLLFKKKKKKVFLLYLIEGAQWKMPANNDYDEPNSKPQCDDEYI